MIKWLMNLLHGTVTISVEGAYLERLLNLCAQQGVVFWGLQWQGSHNLTLFVHRRDLKLFRQLAARLGCNLVVGQGVGLPFFLGRFRHRYAFLAGLVLSVCTVFTLSNFVLSIHVVGNEGVATGEILSKLEELGLKTGVFAPDLDRVAMAQQAVLEMEELSWMAINRYGTYLEVIVRERVMTPKLRPISGLSSVYAEADGIIQSVCTQVGESLVKQGDIVAKGDLLISGYVELLPPQYSQLDSIWMEVPAQGAVFARTWRTLEGEIPLTTMVKEPTGQEERGYFCTIFGNTVNFFRRGSIEGEKCDKIIYTTMCMLPGGVELPITFTTQIARGYTTQQVAVNPSAAQTLLEERLTAQLKSQLEEGENILSTHFTARQQGDVLSVTLAAECEEEIGEVGDLEVRRPQQTQD